jgi:hypothetical protein
VKAGKGLIAQVRKKRYCSEREGPAGKQQQLKILAKFGTFWIAYCADCAWRSDAVSSWQDGETLRFGHVCALEPVLRIDYRAQFAREPIAV